MTSRFKTLLVTGGAGFIGSSFVRQAADSGYQLHVMDKLTYAGDVARLKSIEGQFTMHEVDIADRQAVYDVVNAVKPDALIHFAAETHVDRSILDADTSLKTNFLGTQVLVEAAKNAGTPRFVHISTDEVYGDIEEGQFFESTPLQPSSPYSAGKAAGDLLIRSYIRTYGFPAIIIRPSNNYGPWQYPEKLMPVIIFKALNDEKIPIYGQGLNVREWLYVDDCARGVLAILEKGTDGEIYNIGSGNERTNIDVVRHVLGCMNKPESLMEFVKDRPGHDIRYALNFDKINNEIGWKAAMPFEEGVQKTIDFYVTHQEWLESKVSDLREYWQKVYKK